MKAVALLRLLRIHTASATMGGLVLGYLLMGGELLSPWTLFWIVFGIGYHGWGFLQNNLYDLEHDRTDPSKQHHPLVSGEIGVDVAWRIDMFLLGLLLFAVIALLNPVTVLLFIFSVVVNTVYNKYGKRTLAAQLGISFGYASLPLLSASTLGFPSWTVWVVFSFAVIWMTYMNAFEGGIKDLGADRVNLLKRLGARLDGDVFTPGWPAVATLCIFLVAIPVPLLFLSVHPVFPVLLAFIILLGWLIVRPGVFNRHARVRSMSIQNVSLYGLLILSSHPYIGWGSVTFVFLVPVLYFTMLNRVLWSSWVTPAV